MPELKRYVEIRAFYRPEDAKRSEQTPSLELLKTKRESGLEGVYNVYDLEQAIKETEGLLIGFQLALNFVLWEPEGPVYTADTSKVRKYFLP